MRLLLPALTLSLLVAPATDGFAQCCGTPTVAYSPVVAAPMVAQTTTVSNGWYPGKYLGDFTRNLFGYGSTTTYATNYAPYTAGYAPYTAGYAPYTAGYAPTYSVGYAPAFQQTAYRPTYPATYGVVNYAPLVQEVARPVVLSPVIAASACDTCGGCGACDACSGGVEQAYYGEPASGCSSCAAGGSYATPSSAYDTSLEQQPALAPEENPAQERSIRQRPQLNAPEVDEKEDEFDDLDAGPSADPAAANDYWGAPPLFAPPANRVTRNLHPAPVRTAVYRGGAAGNTATFRGQDTAAAPKTHRLSSSGWASAAD